MYSFYMLSAACVQRVFEARGMSMPHKDIVRLSLRVLDLSEFSVLLAIFLVIRALRKLDTLHRYRLKPSIERRHPPSLFSITSNIASRVRSSNRLSDGVLHLYLPSHQRSQVG